MPVQQQGTAQPNRSANAANPASGLRSGVALDRPRVNSPGLSGQEGAFAGNYGNPMQQPAQPDRVGHIIIEGNEVTGDRVILNQIDLRPGQAAQPPATPTNPDGNRLNSNRNENRSTLMVESRDPARQNAVIHRSYLKK